MSSSIAGFCSVPSIRKSERLAELPGAREHALVHAAREQDPRRDALPCEVAQRFDAVHAGHLQIQQDQRGLAARELIAKCLRRCRR